MNIYFKGTNCCVQRLVKNFPGLGRIHKGLLFDGVSQPWQLDAAVRWPNVFASFRMSVRYTQETMEKAVEKVKAMLADLGGTEILTPLRRVFRKPPIPGHPLQVTEGAEGMKILKTICLWMLIENYGNTVCASGFYWMGKGNEDKRNLSS